MEKRQENLEDKIVKRLTENHLSIATAEFWKPFSAISVMHWKIISSGSSIRK